MRMLLAATCVAGAAVVLAPSAIAGAPSPTPPSDAAIAQYLEAVPSATGPVPVGELTAPAALLPALVRAKVERTAGADAPVLLHVAEDPKFGARPVARAKPAPAGSEALPRPAQAPEPVAPATDTPNPLAAAASTADSGGILLVALLLVGVTAAGIAVKVGQR